MGSSAVAAAASDTEGVEKMKILAPLYARPESEFWDGMVEAGLAANATSLVDISVVVNPNSGPGEIAEDSYTQGFYRLWNAGVEVLCYVPTGFGKTDIANVTSDIDTYQELYPDLCGGYFFDEAPGTKENVWKYTEYYNHAQAVKSYSTVVVNPGTTPDETLYFIGDVYESVNDYRGGQLVVVSFENSFEVFYDLGGRDPELKEVPDIPYTYESWERYRNSIMVYGAAFNDTDESLETTVWKLYCKFWGYTFFTDDSFGDDGNPWDEEPSYLLDLVQAAADASISTDACPTPSPTLSTPQSTMSNPGSPGATDLTEASAASHVPQRGSTPRTTVTILWMAATALGWAMCSMH